VIVRFLTALLGAAALVFVCLPLLTSGAEPARSAALESAVAVERRSFEVRVPLIGELQPVRSKTISSALKSDRGKIIYLVEDGRQVAEGDVLVRFDPTPFEEEERTAQMDVGQAETIVQAREQALLWEEAQAKRRVKTAEFEREVATLDKFQFERGEGPLERARLEGEHAEKDAEWDDQRGFLTELEDLLTRGHVNQAEVEQVKKRAAKAEKAAELARRKFETYRDYILPTRKAALRHRLEQAGMELEQTRVSAEFKIGEARAALEKARRELEAARERLDQARIQLEQCTLKAPLSGIVVHREEFRDGQRRKPRVGDSVWQNQPLLFLPDLTEMIVETRVREVDVHLVQPGNVGQTELDAYPGLRLSARVRSIGVLAERDQVAHGGEKAFSVTVDLLEADPKLRPGMTARVDVLSERVEDALVVPIQALWSADGVDWCWLLDGDKFVRRNVKVGLRSRHHAAILEGLQEGDRVSLVDPRTSDEVQ